MTNSRRSFLAGTGSSLAGLMFCGCGLLHGREARAQAPAAPAVRRGRSKVKTIDGVDVCLNRSTSDPDSGANFRKGPQIVRGIP